MRRTEEIVRDREKFKIEGVRVRVRESTVLRSFHSFVFIYIKVIPIRKPLVKLCLYGNNTKFKVYYRFYVDSQKNLHDNQTRLTLLTELKN